MSSFLSERVIEDILASDKSILSEILGVNASDLSMIARQKIVNSGKLDLLYLCKDKILLIELKIVCYNKDILGQINDYEQDLFELQNQNKLIKAAIKKIILVIGTRENDYNQCKEYDIELLVYKPDIILSKYYENFKELSSFLKIQSGDFGVVRLGLLKNTLAYLAEGLSLKEICKQENRSEKTIRNKISVAQHLNLVSKFKGSFF
jgi:hypothetical protein